MPRLSVFSALAVACVAVAAAVVACSAFGEDDDAPGAPPSGDGAPSAPFSDGAPSDGGPTVPCGGEGLVFCETFDAPTWPMGWESIGVTQLDTKQNRSLPNSLRITRDVPGNTTAYAAVRAVVWEKPTLTFEFDHRPETSGGIDFAAILILDWEVVLEPSLIVFRTPSSSKSAPLALGAALSEWHHFAMTLDYKEGAIDVAVARDGVPSGTLRLPPAPKPLAVKVRLGTRSVDTNNSYNHNYDDVTVRQR